MGTKDRSSPWTQNLFPLQSSHGCAFIGLRVAFSHSQWCNTSSSSSDMFLLELHPATFLLFGKGWAAGYLNQQLFPALGIVVEWPQWPKGFHLAKILWDLTQDCLTFAKKKKHKTPTICDSLRLQENRYVRPDCWGMLWRLMSTAGYFCCHLAEQNPFSG